MIENLSILGKFDPVQKTPFGEYSPCFLDCIINQVLYHFLLSKNDINIKIVFLTGWLKLGNEKILGCVLWETDPIINISFENIKNDISKGTFVQKFILTFAHEIAHVGQYYTNIEFDEKQADNIAIKICESIFNCDLSFQRNEGERNAI